MLLYLSLFTILLSFVLILFNRKSNPNSIYLSLFFIVSSCFGIAHHFVFQTQSVFWIALFFNHWVPFMFLAGPFLFFYVRGTLNERVGLKPQDVLHFIPVLLSGIGTLPYYLDSFEAKKIIASQLIQNVNSLRIIEVNLFYDAGESFVLRACSCFCYLLYCVYLVILFYKVEIKGAVKPSSQKLQVLRWLTILLGSILLILILFFVLAFYAAHVRISETLTNGYVLYVATGIIYLLIALALLQFPNVLYGISLAPKSNPIKEVKNNATNSSNGEIIEDKSVIELAEKINAYVNKEKPYLDPHFSVANIAIALGVSETQISYVIKNIMNSNFVKMRSELRVTHAIGLLTSEARNTLTIEAIGEQSGFKTRSNFYMAFKEVTGVTPTEYINNSTE